MSSVEVVFKGHRGNQFSCVVLTPLAHNLSVVGSLDDVSPDFTGDSVLTRNRALVNNLWAYAKHEKLHRLARHPEKRHAYSKAAQRFRAMVEALARDAENLGSGGRQGWCSDCLTHGGHTKVDGGGPFLTYLCDSCGGRTSPCPAARCPNMAVRGLRNLRIPRFCAEHRHEIPGFEKCSTKLADLAEYGDFLSFERRNLGAITRTTSMAGVVAVATGVTIVSGGTGLPAAVGGALGSLQGLSGAAAVSSGLATLGGGAVAAGGLGMAGGTMVVAAGGSLLAGGLGAMTTMAYVGDDPSFRIEKVHEGSGTPVIVANGFLNEGRTNKTTWTRAIRLRYPDSPVYVVHWGSKDLKRLGALIAPKNAALFALRQQGRKMALTASKAAASRASVAVTAPAVVAGLIKNPWHTAKSRADGTGVALAGLIARVQTDAVILAGHSLGARVAAVAAETLGGAPNTPRVQDVHLLGAAIGAKGDWRALSHSVTGAVHNYCSSNDRVLSVAYRSAQGGSVALGSRGFCSPFKNLVDVDVSKTVAGHSEYWTGVTLK